MLAEICTIRSGIESSEYQANGFFLSKIFLMAEK